MKESPGKNSRIKENLQEAYFHIRFKNRSGSTFSDLSILKMLHLLRSGHEQRVVNIYRRHVSPDQILLFEFENYNA